ncbi:phospholipase C [Trinickia fusca]|uniref:Phospholipase n=1 Tax=Trinickia fusca TaxID=2419777 RepID=A0A494XE63_9BURK|nr:alkaline phosphatase family protein [Trinickia fusca]RKP46424.1 phospholipase [Trinickia fusca]
MFRRQVGPIMLAVASFATLVACGSSNNSTPASSSSSTTSVQDALATTTPIKHLVVIYDENVSFDHYFGTYPNATNPAGEPAFTVAANTPAVNGLTTALLTNNGNATNALNGAGASNPFRLDRSQAATKSQNHAYTAEQQAYDNGLADLFPKYTGRGTSGGAGAFGTNGQVMGYYDGNTVTALWNYAQNFAMSDNAYTSTYGPSTPGALEVISGQTNGMQVVKSSTQPSVAGSYYVNDGQGGLTMINDVDPGYDVCSSTTDQAMMTGKNIGDLLNAQNITWGGFMGGFNLQTTNANGTTNCARSTTSAVVGGSATADYIPHHNWFQYYASTSNPQHSRPSAAAAIGYSLQADGKTADPANHQYDTDDFFAAVKAGNFPSVSFLKAPAYQDSHAGYSDPLDEQAFVTKVINFLQQQPDWANTAVIVAYDDSDGWYDHAYATPTSTSFDNVADQLNAPGQCGSTGTPAPNGVNGKPVNGRCGPGTRVPFLVISPWAKKNYVDHTLINQASVTRFIEDNWLGGARLGGGSFDATAGDIRSMFNFGGSAVTTPLYLDPTTGTQVSTAPQS